MNVLIAFYRNKCLPAFPPPFVCTKGGTKKRRPAGPNGKFRAHCSFTHLHNRLWRSSVRVLRTTPIRS